jgi:hypothetical protein
MEMIIEMGVSYNRVDHKTFTKFTSCFSCQLQNFSLLFSFSLGVQVLYKILQNLFGELSKRFIIKLDCFPTLDFINFQAHYIRVT